MENCSPNKPIDQELKINLAALRKCDEFVLDILETSSQVALYKFDHVKQEWEKTEIEGSLFLYRRSTLPKFALMVMNRLNRENLNEYISKEMEFKVQKPFLLYKNASMDILGIWFNNPDNCAKIGELITGLYTSPILQKPKAATRENEKSIFTMFANAQREYVIEQNKICDASKNGHFPQNGPISKGKSFDASKGGPFSLAQPQNGPTSTGKARSKSLSTAGCRTQISPTLLVFAVENEDTQTLHDPCIVKSSPLRPSPGILSHSLSLPNSTKKTIHRQLFTQDIPSAPITQLPSEKIPFPSLPSEYSPVKAVTNKSGMLKQRSSSDISMAAALMSPLAFQATKTSYRIPKSAPETPTLTKDQLQQTLLYLLEKDSDFLEKIHATYLKNVSR